MKVRPTKRLDARKYNVNDCVERIGESFLGPYSSEKKLPVLGQILGLPETAGM